MVDIKEQFSEMLSLMHLFLAQEYQKNDFVITDSDHFFYFKKLAKPKLAPPIKKVIHENQKSIKETTIKNEEIIIPQEEVEKPQKIVSPVKTTSLTSVDLNDIKEIMQKKFPQVTLYSEPLEDSRAKNIASKWKYKVPEILIFYLNENSENMSFLLTMSKGLQQKIGETQIVAFSESNQSFQCKLAIATEDCKEAMKNFIQKINEDYFISNIPIIFMTNISSYIQDPQLKLILWKEIQRLMKKSLSQ